MSAIAVLAGYLIGALPMGFIFVWLIKRQNLTQIGSGRTGGTNAMRAGGIWLGLLTGIMDLAKGFFAVQFARWLAPGQIWAHVMAGFFAVLGHNWSIWLFLFTGKLSAGAGTGPNVGAALAFWPWTIAAAVPLVLFFVFVIGYASLASLSTAVVVALVFAAHALWGSGPWQYVAFSLMTLGLIAWALRPNIVRLLNGNERRVGIFARRETN